MPPYDELILVAHKDKTNDPKFSRFMGAVERAAQFLVNHPDDSWKLFIGAHKKLNDELNRRAWRDTLPRFAMRPGALDTVRYRRFAEFLKKQGLIKKTVPLESYAIQLP